MSLRHRVGQLVTLGFGGLTLPRHVTRWVERWDLGGLFYFGPNIADRAQVRALSDEVQRLPASLPLFVAIDQEGGRVQQWGPPHWRSVPAAHEIGASFERTGDLDSVRALGREVGLELRALGVNTDFAPVLDVHTNPSNPVIGDRAFGTTPQTAAACGIAFALGLQDVGVSACGKHFPGHGDTLLDSHKALPFVTHDAARLEATELSPFRHAVVAGIDSMMSAHVVYPAWDDVPATISRAIMTGILRERLGFDGVIFTDDMKMRGIRQEHDLLEAALRALEAGCDVVLSCTEFDAHEALLAGLTGAVDSGRLSEARVAASLARVERVKRRRLLGS